MTTESSDAVRSDFFEKVTGRAEFISDLTLPGMLQGRVLRSPIPHGFIKSIDVSAALEMEGVVTVLTGADLVGLDANWGLFLKDRPVIAVDRVRYVGEPVAMVAAIDERTAEEALELIQIDYEPLPFVTDASEAMGKDAPLLHDEHRTLKDFYFKGEAKPVPGTNIYQNYRYEHGDVEKAFVEADRCFEDEFDFPMVFHYAMEPHCVVASFGEDGLTVWSCGQSPTAVQKVLARIFNLPLARVRVLSPYVGGGFGGKASVKIDPLVAALAWKARRPVRVCLSISESMLTARRLSARVSIKTAVRNDGTLLGKSVRVIMNGGAYADTGPAVAIKAANRAIGPYHFPNLRLESLAVYTNTVPGAAFRSIGGPQAVWATESQMDIIATTLGLDPVEFRYHNMLKRGEHVRPDLRPIDVDMAEAMGLASQAMSRLEAGAPGLRLSNGTALGVSDPGILPVASLMLRLKIDGSVLVVCNSVEIGQGVREVLRRLAAEHLHQKPSAVSVLTPDTATAPFDWGTGASRSSLMMGMAIEDAARDIRRQLCEVAAIVLGVDPSTVDLRDGGVVAGDRFVTFMELLHAYYGIDSGEIVAIGRISPHSRDGNLALAPLFWETAAGRCAVELDEDTGEIRVRRYVSVADIGRVVNRAGAEGQDEGAAIMGLGHALSEELLYSDGQPINATMIDYHVPTIDEVPDVFATILIENRDGPGPGGMRGMGEGAILPMAPAIANALAAGFGIRVRELPLTPERVWRALQAKKGA
ncbi:xanthine dehydrogenase family protein molybdopterin-binding subunit [Bradyrhizobium sp. NP1]|uniref:xanthine dehydrogenase family protein molybdopterin-binding subunit n=1 Tax=Bradyrhizobium sp. NP1 TaxID=3049772 RepID=UPI0025A67D39|nr:xanthine dehydrogenase family protein molybdopterin-binding subunit [Bradyrhizobium sp. NP1]WJR80880.1 xanthine dehydrogenase family protein molybdopterin-binding subunit [Bradyrhizobium sp. NP1]